MIVGRALAVAPAALLASGCVLAPYTPSELVTARAAQDEPDLHTVAVPSRAEAIARWQLPPSSPWGRFEKLTLLASIDEVPRAAELPDVDALDVVQAARGAAYAVASSGLPRGTAWIVDARGAASVAFGALLSQLAATPIAAVPTFHHWPAEDELIPAEETLAALVAAAPRLPPDDPSIAATPVFLLDAWRLAYKDEAIDDDVTDNRYMLGEADLPSAEALRAQGITRVLYVVAELGDDTCEEDDLHATFLAWQAAGIRVHVVDFAWLAGLYEEPRWEERLAARAVVVAPRATIVSDPAFYARARGGFGGVHGVPWHGGGGGGGFHDHLPPVIAGGHGGG